LKLVAVFGKVIDVDTKKPISGALVTASLREDTSALSGGIAGFLTSGVSGTDERSKSDGTFSIALASWFGENKVRVETTAPGYSQDTRSIQAGDTVVIALKKIQ
jgi:hypothetical protein